MVKGKKVLQISLAVFLTVTVAVLIVYSAPSPFVKADSFPPGPLSLGVTIEYPDGVWGLEPLTYNLYNNPYTVPQGKNLYILNTNRSIMVDDQLIFGGPNLPHLPLMFGEGQVLSGYGFSSGYGYSYLSTFNAFTVDAIVTPVTYTLSLNGEISPYTVPEGKILYIMYMTGFWEDGWKYLTIDGLQLQVWRGSVHTTDLPIIMDEGEIISFVPGNSDVWVVFNGYLSDK